MVDEYGIYVKAVLVRINNQDQRPSLSFSLLMSFTFLIS